MLAYNKTYNEFCSDINGGIIVSQIQSALNRSFSDSEKKAFKVSLSSVKNALSNVYIPSGAQVGLELNVPLTNKRIDFIIAGEEYLFSALKLHAFLMTAYMLCEAFAGGGSSLPERRAASARSFSPFC